MPRPTIEEIRGVGDFATLYQWSLNFVTFPTRVGEGGSYPTLEEANLRCESADLPKATSQKITAEIRGHKVHSPGIQEYSGSFALTFIETIDNKISLFLKAWREACWQVRTGIQGTKQEVECQISIERMNRNNEPIWTYNLFGCFLEDYEVGTLDGATSDFFKPAMTVSFDYFEEG